MCKNPKAIVVSLMTAIEPTLKDLLTIEGVAGTAEATTALAEYDQAVIDIQNWTPGTAAEDTEQAVTDFVSALDAIPLSGNVKLLIDTIAAGAETVIGVISAYSPPPAGPTDSIMAPEDITAAHQADIAATTAQKVTALVPGFKRSIFHTPESQYKSTWNSAVTSGGFPASMKV